ncbi:hypothetical protein ACQR1N_25570 [Bradyrhizobium sp. HKCCYLRH1073]|uniref:hypothetical protein n=1 Tax=unclassified Bradyrhizobium TaxID=2631580 RepID=UPI003EBCDC91
MKLRSNNSPIVRRNGAPTQVTRTPSIPTQIPGPENPGPLADLPSEAANHTLTVQELINRAKHNIEVGETSRATSFRAAAEDIALACDQGAKQREVAEAVGKSAAWVNRLLKWREGGYVGAPFADKIVQGVNKDDSLPEVALTEPPLDVIAPGAPTTQTAVLREGERPAESAIAEATNTLSDAPPADYYHPQEFNRQDPERAFQRLADQWSSSAFRDLFLDSPKAAQERFVRDVLLADLCRPKPVASLPPVDWAAR